MYQSIYLSFYLSTNIYLSWLVRGIIPKWPYFRLGNYYNLLIYIYMYIHIYTDDMDIQYSVRQVGSFLAVADYALEDETRLGGDFDVFFGDRL